MNFDLRHIRYFCTVAEELHFGRAARKLHIAQPAISRTIAQLERELGLRLLERNNRKVALTVAGKAFLDSCYDIQQSLRESVMRARKADSGELGHLAIGYTDFAIMGSLPHLLKEFRQQYPEVSVTPMHAVTAKQLKNLKNEKIDIGFVTGPIPMPEFHCCTVQEDRYAVVLYKSHPLVKQKTVRLSQLMNEPFILGTADAWQHYHEHLFRICRNAGFTIDAIQQAYNSEAIFGLVACEMGITIHLSCARNYRREGLVIRDIDDINDTIPTQAIWRENNESPVVKMFVEFLLAQSQSTPP